ncbi:uncharacterized protein EV422DRAFT_77985 [Fimicolochytrium jonesii]|uniref:uncharacterized protein n=1 Tax=Fimicolochytrium jonesii TaxID=1396493 RepID=UPI0022FE514C|nr:uncharacterized protein EV422DRAFT_77985 [Fimicolochytrium jonesii]KAI8820086.1 hypothetical protein EV422DRAFT_77985 [Fimicolochytrium jonesii]
MMCTTTCMHATAHVRSGIHNAKLGTPLREGVICTGPSRQDVSRARVGVYRYGMLLQPHSRTIVALLGILPSLYTTIPWVSFSTSVSAQTLPKSAVVYVKSVCERASWTMDLLALWGSNRWTTRDDERSHVPDFFASLRPFIPPFLAERIQQCPVSSFPPLFSVVRSAVEGRLSYFVRMSIRGNARLGERKLDVIQYALYYM